MAGLLLVQHTEAVTRTAPRNERALPRWVPVPALECGATTRSVSAVATRAPLAPPDASRVSFGITHQRVEVSVKAFRCLQSATKFGSARPGMDVDRATDKLAILRSHEFFRDLPG